MTRSPPAGSSILDRCARRDCPAHGLPPMKSEGHHFQAHIARSGSAVQLRSATSEESFPLHAESSPATCGGGCIARVPARRAYYLSVTLAIVRTKSSVHLRSITTGIG